ncbi:MAG: hypothetical protein IT252_17100 [Chitinophagaceae bacterium]|nr:hypothetical protein [Chitinophagaceae bacterium]
MFTFILEFRGGTYVSQSHSSTLSKAINDWGEKLLSTDVKYLGLSGKKQILCMLEEVETIPLNGLINTWFFCLNIRQGFLSVNVVKTAT